MINEQVTPEKSIIVNQNQRTRIDFLNAAAQGDLLKMIDLIYNHCLYWLFGYNNIHNIAKKDYVDAFLLAVQNGKTDVINLLFSATDCKMQTSMLRYNNYAAFTLAAKNRQTGVMKLLLDFPYIHNSEKLAMIRYNQHAVLHEAANNGCLEIIKLLLDYINNANTPKLNTSTYRNILLSASSNNHLEVTAFFLDQIDRSKREEMIYRAYKAAAINGHLETTRFLLNQLNNDKKKEMILSPCYGSSPFPTIARNGHITVMEFLLNQLDDSSKKKLIIADDFEAFGEASIERQIEVMKFLLNHVDEVTRKKMIASENFRAIWYLASDGATEAIDFFLNYLNDAEKQEMMNHFNTLMIIGGELFGDGVEIGPLLKSARFLLNQFDDAVKRNVMVSDNYRVLRNLAYFGEIDFMRCVLDHVDESERQLIISNKDYEICISALGAAINSQETRDFLFGYISDSVKLDMMCANDFYAFDTLLRTNDIKTIKLWFNCLDEVKKTEMLSFTKHNFLLHAALIGALETMEFLFNNLNDAEKQMIICFKNYKAFKLAAKNGHVEVMALILKNVNHDTRCEMISLQDDRGAFLEAADNGKIEVMKFLLNLNNVYDDAIIHNTLVNATNLVLQNKVELYLNIISEIKNLLDGFDNNTRKEIVRFNDYILLVKALRRSNEFNAVELLWSYLDEGEKSYFICKFAYDAFIFNIKNNYNTNKVILFLFNAIKETCGNVEIQRILSIDNYEVLKIAAENLKNYPELITLLWDYLSDNQKLNIINHQCCTLFMQASFANQVEIMQLLFNNATDSQKYAMIRHESYSAFTDALSKSKGDAFESIKFLIQSKNIDKAEKHLMIHASEDRAFIQAATNITYPYQRERSLEFLIFIDPFYDWNNIIKNIANLESMRLEFYQESLKTITQIITITAFSDFCNAKYEKLQNKTNNSELPEKNQKTTTAKASHSGNNAKPRTSFHTIPENIFNKKIFTYLPHFSLLESKKTIEGYYNFKEHNPYEMELYFDFLRFELANLKI